MNSKKKLILKIALPDPFGCWGVSAETIFTALTLSDQNVIKIILKMKYKPIAGQTWRHLEYIWIRIEALKHCASQVPKIPREKCCREFSSVLTISIETDLLSTLMLAVRICVEMSKSLRLCCANVFSRKCL